MERTGGNREYQDLHELRRDVVRLFREGRFELTRHAETTHPDIPAPDKVAAVLFGGQDRPNRGVPPGRPSYVCWYGHPRLGLLRAVYAVVEPPTGGLVLIITVFPE